MVVKKKPKKVKSVERQKIKNTAVLNDSNMNNNQQQVQIIFPSDMELRKTIPFVIWTSEFDFYRRDCLDLAKRGKRFNKLLEFSDMPGVYHGYQLLNFDTVENKTFYL